MQPYYGLVQGPVDLRFKEDITLSLRFIKVVEHGEPVLILGSDLLRGGRPLSSWNFECVGCHTREVGKVEGFLKFVKSGTGVEVPILNAPAGLSERKVGVRLRPESAAFTRDLNPTDPCTIPELIMEVCTICARTGYLGLACKACQLKYLWRGSAGRGPGRCL